MGVKQPGCSKEDFDASILGSGALIVQPREGERNIWKPCYDSETTRLEATVFWTIYQLFEGETLMTLISSR
mgnify:FL=1